MIQNLNINNFAGGLNLTEMPENLNPNEFADCLNILLTHRAQPEPRLGCDYLGTSAGPASASSLAIYQKSDNTEEVLVRAGDQLYKFVSPNTWTEIQKAAANAFAAGGDRTCFVNYDYKIYIMDGYNFLRYDGTTLIDVPHGEGVDFFPKFGAVHDGRLFVGNFYYDGVWHSRSLSWMSPYDDTDWKTDAAFNEIEFDHELTNLVSFEHLLVFTRRVIYYTYHDTTFYNTYYYPSVKVFREIGAAPWTAMPGARDVFFANESGVYTIRAVQEFGDLEAARISRKLDPIFKDDLYLAGIDNLSAIYVDYRDEYWLSIPLSATTYQVLVAKPNIRDEQGNLPWTVLDLSYRDWVYQPKAQNVLFTDQLNGTVLKYGGRSDRVNSGGWTTQAIETYYRTANIGSQEYNRKRFMMVDGQFIRWGNLDNAETGQLKIYLDNNYDRTLAPGFPAGPTRYIWGTVAQGGSGLLWGPVTHVPPGSGGIWQSKAASKDEVYQRHRISRIGRDLFLEWRFSSQVSGAMMTQCKIRFEEAQR